MQYCSIINCTSNKGGILTIIVCADNFSRCNFIRNEEKNENGETGLITFSGCDSHPIESLAFIGNKCQYLFFINDGTPEIKNCYFDKSNEISSTINVDTIDIGTTDMLSNNISYFSSCFGKIENIDKNFEHLMDISKFNDYAYIMNTLLSMPIFIFISR